MSILDTLINYSLNGNSVYDSAYDLAAAYRRTSYRNNDARIAALIKNTALQSGVTGFGAGLGGPVTAVVTLSASTADSLLRTLRMIFAIAILRGYDPRDPTVRTMCLLAMTGGQAQGALRAVGVRVTGRLTRNALRKLPGKLITKINQIIGMRLLTKFGSKGIVNLVRFVPVIASFAGAAIDYAAVSSMGHAANSQLRDML